MIIERLRGSSKIETLRPKYPTVIGVVPNQEEFSSLLPHSDGFEMAIDFESSSLGLPQELMQFFPTLNLIVIDALSRNNKFRSNPYNIAYMDLFQEVIKEDHSQSAPHLDGGAKNVYVVADIEPTLFFVQKYKLPRGKYLDWADSIAKQSRAESIWKARPYDIILFDGRTTVHSSPPTSGNLIRTFVRVGGFS